MQASNLAEGVFFPMLLAALALGGCKAGSVATTGQDSSQRRGTLEYKNPTCGEMQEHVSVSLTPISMDHPDPFVRSAIAGAAKGGGVSVPEIRSNYCLFDRNHDGKRCYVFLDRRAAVGGEIYLCVSPQGETTNLYLGE